jgi:flavin reductase (DIM6/NTAB) family NADH-FMN oxidoreductase RutF
VSTHLVIEPSILYFGTPVVLIGTLNEDGSANLAPMSSAWALGYSIVLGLGNAGQTIRNLLCLPECTINLPEATQWRAVERLAPLTGRNPVPPEKASQFRFEADKFAAAGLTPRPSDLVGPPRVAECPLQFEATITAFHRLSEGAHCVEARVMRVHAAPELVIEGSDHIDPSAWQPLLYVFRHYFGPGEALGRTFRAEA